MTKEQEKIDEAYKDKVKVNYNIIKNLVEIKKILLANFELLSQLIEKNNTKEERESVFKNG